MTLDVTTDVVIDRPVRVVSAYASDPRHAPEWSATVRSVELLDGEPLGVGSRMRFVTTVLGRRLEYTYEVIELEPGVGMTMATTSGPFPMTTEYRFVEAGFGRTLVTLRNHGEPSGFGMVAAPVVRRQMERANRRDLETLKQVLESR